jgi:cyclic pyranopterin phosphate synthase
VTQDLRIDSHKLHFHPHRVAQWLDGKSDWETAKSIYPIYAELSPIGGCNHSCLFCGVDMVLEANKAAKNIPQLESSMLKDRLTEMAELGLRSVMWAGAGEPLLHRDIVGMTEHAHRAGLDISFTTNGVLLKPELLPVSAWIKVSLNAGTAESYAKIHRCKEKDFERVWTNLEKAVAVRAETKADCTLGVQAVLLPENDKDMVTLAKRCRDTGVDYLVIKPYSQAIYSLNRMLVKYDHYQKLEDDLAALNTNKFQVVFRASSMKAVSEKIPYTTCGATGFMWCYVEADGSVYSCSAYLTDKRFLIGNVNQNSFKEIWEGEGRRTNYELMKTLDISQCRKSCRMHASNMYLWDLEHAPHRSFI